MDFMQHTQPSLHIRHVPRCWGNCPRCQWLKAIIGSEWSHTNGIGVRTVDRKLSGWKKQHPILLSLETVASKHLLHDSVHTLNLAVRLRMICSRHGQTRTQTCAQCVPKARCETSVSIADHTLGYPMKADHLADVVVRDVPCRVRRLARNQMHHACQVADDRHNGVIPLTTRQWSHKVDADRLPRSARHGKSLGLPCRLRAKDLVTLTHITVLDVCCDTMFHPRHTMFHPRPPEVGASPIEHRLDTQVTRPNTVVYLRKMTLASAALYAELVATIDRVAIQFSE
mmetsp:Transcript_36241/g.91127  ORF Transcript_36241/g.91127 Transcript_36241/m.91127 type:complete len:284 (-) Transcript_36241:292-1143(-)